MVKQVKDTWGTIQLSKMAAMKHMNAVPSCCLIYHSSSVIIFDRGLIQKSLELFAKTDIKSLHHIKLLGYLTSFSLLSSLKTVC